MALNKSIVTPSGVAASYWKVTATNINWHAEQAHFDMAGFHDEAARQANAAPLDTVGVDFDPETFPFAPDDNVVQMCYLIAKFPPEGVVIKYDFTDAIDC